MFAKRPLEVLEMCKIPKRMSLFSPNINEVVTNYSPGSPYIRQLLVNCSPLFTKLSPKTENVEQLGIIWENSRTFCNRLVTVWRRFGERLAKCLQIIHPTFSIYSPNICRTISYLPIDHHVHHLVTRCLPNDLKTINFSSLDDLRICQLFANSRHFLSPNCR